MKTRIPYSLILIAAIVILQVSAAWPSVPVEETREAIRLGKYGRALKLLNTALDENPLDPAAHLLMTEYYLALQDYMAAELSTERTLVLNRTYAPLVAQAYFIAGERATKRNQLPQALALYETAVAIDPAFKNRVKGKYLILGNDLLAEGKLASAMSAYSQEIALNPTTKKTIADAALSRGRSFLGSDEKAADTLFSYALSLDPSCSPRVGKAKTDYGLELLNRAQAATGEERRKLKEQSLRYLSKEVADHAIPPTESDER